MLRPSRETRRSQWSLPQPIAAGALPALAHFIPAPTWLRYLRCCSFVYDRERRCAGERGPCLCDTDCIHPWHLPRGRGMRAVSVCVFASLLLFAACGGGGDGKKPTIATGDDDDG